MKFICQSVTDLPVIANRIFNFGIDYKIWLLKGEMGSGKTTLVHAITDMLGINDQVSSPSYGILNEYLLPDNNKIYHFDFFRIKSLHEIFDIGFEEYIDSGNYCFIEWPEIAGPLLPSRFLEIKISVGRDGKRSFNIQKNG